MRSRGRAIVLGGLGVVAGTVLITAAVMSLRRTEPEPEVETTTTTMTAAAVQLTDPRTVAQAFLTAWIQSDWSSMDSIVTDLSASRRHSLWMRNLEVADLDLVLGEVMELSGGRATAPFSVAVDIAGRGVWTYETQMVLIWDGATWLVDWLPGVLHEQLTSGDSLELEHRWPERAPILALDGTVLATTMPTVFAGIIPNRVESRADVREAFAAFTDVDPAVVDEVMDVAREHPDWWLPVVEIPREQYPDVRPALYGVPGVAFRDFEGRASVEEGLAQHVLGATGAITEQLLEELGDPYRSGHLVGLNPSSLERTHERSLAGTPALDIVKVSSDGSEREVLHTFEGEASVPLSTTLFLSVQRAAEAAIATVETPAALVAIDVATGDIRAAVSRPLDGFNRAVTGRYPPGSTFKLVVTLAALESGYTSESEIECPEEVLVGGQAFHNAARLPGSMTLEEALVRSCNTAFIQLSGMLDQVAIEAAASKLGFNQDYTIGLGTPGASYPTPTSPTEAAAAAIGQANVLATPVHMASLAAALAGEGWRPPSLLARNPITPANLIDSEIAETIRALMIEVVEDRDGTGKAARVEGLTVGGKTGTAQLGSGEEDPLVAWFIGFSDNIAFAIMIEEGESGGQTAAPVAATFLEFLAQTSDDPAEGSCVNPANGWPTFQGSNARTGCVVGVPVILDPEVKWAVEVGVQAWLNNPVIVDDLVIVGTAGSVRNQSDSTDGIAAVRLSDGRTEWRVDAVRDVNGIAAAGKRVVITGDEGTVWSLRASDGRVKWTFAAGTLVYTNPLIVKGIVVVGDAAGILWGLDLEDGTVVWQKFLAGAIRGGAASDGRLIYAGTDQGDVIAVNLDGDTIWDRTVSPSADPLGEVAIFAAPTVTEEMVVFSVIEDGFEGPALVALDKYLGTERWRARDVIGARWSNVRSSTALSQRELLFAGDLTTGVQAVDGVFGSAVWDAGTPALCDEQWASPVVIDGTVILPRSDGSLYAIDTSSQRILWQLAITSAEGPSRADSLCSVDEARVNVVGLQATPAVAPDGTIVVGSLGGWLYAVGERES